MNLKHRLQTIALPKRFRRNAVRFFDRCTFVSLALFLSLMVFFNFGLNYSTHYHLIPLVSLMLIFHGLTLIFSLRNKESTFHGFFTLILFLPFLFWLIINANFVSSVSWVSKLHLIFYFEAFVVLWMSFYHLNSIQRFGRLAAVLIIPIAYSLYVGGAQFFQGRIVLNEDETTGVVTGLFYDSTSFVFFISVIFATLMPAVFMRYWEKVKQFGLFIFGALFFLGALLAQDILGYGILFMSLIVAAYISFNKVKKRYYFTAFCLFFSGVIIALLFLLFPFFKEQFFIAFEFEGSYYYFEALKASLLLFAKNPLAGIGLGNFSYLVPTLTSVALPLKVDNPNNSLLLILSELGVVGLLLLLIPLFVAVKKCFKVWKESPRREILYSSQVVSTQRFALSITMCLILSILLGGFLLSISRTPFFICLLAIAFTPLGLFTVSKERFILLKSKPAKFVYSLLSILLAVSFFYDSRRMLASAASYEVGSYILNESFFENESERLRLLEEALFYADRSLEKNKDNVDAWILKNEIINGIYNINSFHFMEFKEPLLISSKEALALNESYWKAWLRYAISSSVAGDSVEAEQAFAKAVEMAPQSFETNFFMAVFLFNDPSKLEEAKSYAERALAIEPKNELALDMIRKLKI